MNPHSDYSMEMFMRSKTPTVRGAVSARFAMRWMALATVLWCGLIAPSETEKGPLRSRVYKLRHTDSQAVKSLLMRLKIGSDYNALSSDVLIVTSDRSIDLVKATSVVSVADNAAGAEMRVLYVPTEELPLPKPEELAVRAKSVTIGSLLDGPPTGSPNPAVVDVQDGTLIAIAAPQTLTLIEAAVEQWKQDKQPKPQPQAESEPTVEKSDEPKPALAEAAGQIFATQAAAEEPLPDAVKQEPAPQEPIAKEQMDTDAFLAQELVDTLNAEAQKAKASEPSSPTPPPAAVEPPMESAPVDEPVTADDLPMDEPAAEDNALRAALAELLKSAQQEEQTAAPKSDAAAAAQPQKKETPRAVTEPTLTDAMAEEELEVTITLPEEVELEALVQLVGKQLKLNYMYDPAIIRGQKITLMIHDGKIKVRDTYALLESALRFRGFVMTRRGNLVTIARREEVGTVDPVIRLPDEPIQPGDVVVSSVFKLKHITPASAQNMLMQMKLGSEFSAVPETGTLIVTDYAFRMERIRNVIAMIDVSGTLKTFQYRQLRYMQAAELAPKVQTLAQQMQNITVTVATQTQAGPMRTQIDPQTRRPVQVPVQPGQPGQPPLPGMPMTAAESNRETVYLEADERTNRVLMIGHQTELKLVNELIDSLDVPGYNLRFIREYVIQYVEASEIITVLGQLGVANVGISGGYDAMYGMGTSRQTMSRTMRPQPQPQQPGQPQQPVQPGMMMDYTTTALSPTDPYIALRAATNSLLVNATEEQHKAIEMVITHVDVKQKDQRTIKEYEIQHVDTQSILDTLTALGIISGKKSEKDGQTGMYGQSNRPMTPQQQMQYQQQMMMAQQMQAETGMALALPTAEGTEREISAAEPQIAVLPTTNSLLVHATPRQHQAIALVIAHADRQLEQMATPYMVYALENQDPEELAKVLNDLIKETIEEAAGTQASAPDAKIQTKPTGIVKLPSGEEQRIRIIPDPKTYSLVVYANKRNQQWVGELIRELDNYRPQVLLDCTLVEITKDDSFKYEIDLLSKIYSDLTLRPGTTGSYTGAPPVGYLGGTTAFSSSQYGHGISDSGTFSGFYNSDMIQGVLSAVQTKGYGRVMSKPKILVNDNQEGEIKTTTKTSIAQQKSMIQPSSDPGQTITTTDVSFAEYSAGVTLNIKPHISKGDMLRLEITLSRTDFKLQQDVTVAGQTYPRPPDLLSTDVKTVATVPDGTTIILGGLEDVNQQKSSTKVPILGDIPLIGGLFRGVDNQGNQGRLYVFVKANIIRPGNQLEGLEDIKRVSGKFRKQFEQMEGAFQKAQDWPGIPAKPQYPETVLEEDDAEESGRSVQPSEKQTRVLTDEEFADLKRRLDAMEKAEKK